MIEPEIIFFGLLQFGTHAAKISWQKVNFFICVGFNSKNGYKMGPKKAVAHSIDPYWSMLLLSSSSLELSNFPF